MAFCRRGAESDVYVFEAEENQFICCRCPLRERGDTVTADQAGMVAHLLEHRAAGHMVPEDALEELRAEAAALAASAGESIASEPRADAPTQSH